MWQGLNWYFFIVLWAAVYVVATLIVIRLFREHRDPRSTLAWLLLMLVLPHFGVALYFLVGGRKQDKSMFNKPYLYELPPSDGDPTTYTDDLDRLLVGSGVPRAVPGNRIEVFPNGEATYQRVMEILGGAQRSIHLITFIFTDDAVGRAVRDLLCEKARAGVEVRVLLDAVGCWSSKKRFMDPLREAGGQVGVFLPVLTLRHKWSANLRNHRKIVVVDDAIGVVGGMNIAEEYMGPAPLPGRWKDYCQSIEGPVVEQLQRLFTSDWAFVTGETLPVRAYEGSAGRLPGDATAQVVPSGPDVQGDPLLESLTLALYHAERRIWIVTPYFVPDETTLSALSMQARMGRDVRIIIPEYSNRSMINFAAGYYLRRLEKDGVKVMRYRGEGMLHAKLVIVDTQVALTGSANMDMRSMYFNYEIGMFIYTPLQIGVIADWVQSMFPDCSYHWPEYGPWKQRLVDIGERFSRLLAPLL